MKRQMLGACAVLLCIPLLLAGCRGGPMGEGRVPEQTYDAESFYQENGYLHYDDGVTTARLGIDVSAHQGWIDWQQVADSEVEFAMLRVGYRGYTDGNLFQDDYWEYNSRAASAAGLPLGVYFFSQATNEREAREEARFVAERLEGLTLDYPVVYDWEPMGAGSRTAEMDPGTLTDCAAAFCGYLTEQGYTAGIYFNQDYGYKQFNLVTLEDYTFWLAEYDETPQFRYRFEMWQYTSSGTVPGIDTNVDLNLAFVTEEAPE